MTSDAYLALVSIVEVSRREMIPTTKNTLMNPTEVAALTTSARSTLARCVVRFCPSIPRKYIKYDGSSTNPHGFTAAKTPSRKLYAKLPSSASTMRHLRAGYVVQNRIQCRLVDGSEEGLGGAVRGNDDERRLRRYFEPEIHIAGIVADRRERQAVLIDELLKRFVIARPGDPDELDGPCPTCTCRFDRSGFSITHASSGRPEPERNRSAGVRGPVELAAADQRRSKGQRCWHLGRRRL